MEQPSQSSYNFRNQVRQYPSLDNSYFTREISVHQRKARQRNDFYLIIQSRHGSWQQAKKRKDPRGSL